MVNTTSNMHHITSNLLNLTQKNIKNHTITIKNKPEMQSIQQITFSSHHCPNSVSLSHIPPSSIPHCPIHSASVTNFPPEPNSPGETRAWNPPQPLLPAPQSLNRPETGVLVGPILGTQILQWDHGSGWSSFFNNHRAFISETANSVPVAEPQGN